MPEDAELAAAALDYCRYLERFDTKYSEADIRAFRDARQRLLIAAAQVPE